MEEKRKYIRVDAPLVFTYKVIGEAPVNKKSATKDFSEGGIRFFAYDEFKVGAILDLRIEIPLDTMPVFTKGQIVRVASLKDPKEDRDIYDIGVQFVQMKDFDKKRMAKTAEYFLSMGKQYRAA